MFVQHVPTRFLAALLASAAVVPAQAQGPLEPVAIHSGGVHVSAVRRSAPERYEEALRLRASGDEAGAYDALLSAARRGHAKAQRKLGEFYDRHNAVVGRDRLESIFWYQKAREQGEEIAGPVRRSVGVLGPAT